jgi:hypothetical protein
LIDFVEELQDEVARYTEDPVVVRTEHNGEIFRAAKIVVACGGLGGDKLGRRGRRSKLWGFVDDLMIPQNNGIRIAGLMDLPRGVCHCRERLVLDGPGRHRYVRYICSGYQGVGNIAGGSVTKLKFYLADVEAFSAPMVVIPDIGGDPNAYFLHQNRLCWRRFLVDKTPPMRVLILDDEESDSDIDEEDTKEKTARR